ncbi:hypothetical protein LCGC14_2813910, partial [marine sediment metagenome]
MKLNRGSQRVDFLFEQKLEKFKKFKLISKLLFLIVVRCIYITLNNKEIFIPDFQRHYIKNGLIVETIQLFQKIIYNYYESFKREFPFRKNLSPYHVLVSEIMLQQTQTKRVSEKFLEFIKKFPDYLSLANSPLEEVLKVWQGLGYNRRAIALRKIAEIIITTYNGKLPESIEILKSFPQIGHNTASSIVTFAFNKPTIFIETNIKIVY